MEKIKACMTALHEAAPEIEVMADEPMRRHTSFAIGGPADLFVMPKTIGHCALHAVDVNKMEAFLQPIGES